MPLEGAQPVIGTVGQPSAVDEERIEVVVERALLTGAVRAIRAAHPYEEPVIFAMPLLDLGGIG